LSRECLTSFNSSTYGYFAGGRGSGTSSIERLDFTSNSIAMMTAVLSRSCRWPCSCNSSTSGYITSLSYNESDYFSDIDKYLFSSDVIQTLVATLNTIRRGSAACQTGDFYQ